MRREDKYELLKGNTLARGDCRLIDQDSNWVHSEKNLGHFFRQTLKGSDENPVVLNLFGVLLVSLM
jgi:hypothetical protein